MKKITRRKFIVGSIFSTLGLVLFDAFWFERFFIETNEFFLETDNNKENLKILQVSDLHLNNFGIKEQNILKNINDVKADIVLFTGDVIDKKENLALLELFLKGLEKQSKKAAILGNWEYWGKIDIQALSKLYSNYKIDLLINENINYKLENQGVNIIGIDDFLGGKPNYKKSIENVQKSDYQIVMTHCPEHKDMIAKEKTNEKIDLVLSGHTHGGQINILGYVPFKPKGSGKYLSGWYKSDDLKLYVSKGIGTSILPVRFGSRAELTVFYFPKKTIS